MSSPDFLLILSDLGFDCNDDVQILHAYLLIRSLIGQSETTDKTISEIARSPAFHKMLNAYHIPCPKEITYPELVLLENACDYISGTPMVNSCKHYVEKFTPFLVANWDGLKKSFLDESDSRMLFSLHAILRLVSHEIYINGTEALTEIFTLHNTEFKRLSVDLQTYLSCCHAIFGIESYHRKFRQRPELRRAIKCYDQYKLPRTLLLSDYADVQMNRSELDHSYNPFLHLQRNIKKIPVESGTTDWEDAFNTAAFKIKREKASEVIQHLFYPEIRDDSGMECSVFLHSCLQYVPFGKILVVNPSPEFLTEWTSRFEKNTTFYVTDNTVSTLYQKEYPEHRFLAIAEHSTDLTRYDFIVILARDTAPEALYPAFAKASQQARVIAFLPQNALDGRKPLYSVLQDNNLVVQRILEVPAIATNSTPRKKMILWVKWSDIVSSFDVYYSNYHTDKLLIENKHLCVEQNYLRDCHTLLQIKSTYQDRETNYWLTKTDAETYRFSNEIFITYIPLPYRKGAYGARAYYRRQLRPQDIHRKRGDRVTDKIEKGLRADSQDEVLAKLEYVAFDSRLWPAIMDDIIDYYSGDLNGLSLKTIWFCCRPELLTKSNYDDALAQDIFCSNHLDIESLIPDLAEPEEIQAAVAAVIPENARKGIKYWKLLNLILNTAKDLSYISTNPIAPLLNAKSKAASLEVQEVRNALTKKFFNQEEEFLIHAFLTEGTPGRCVTDSQYLASAISLFTGLPLREVSALTWEDFAQIHTWDAWQLTISKCLNENAQVFPYSNVNNWIRCRIVPVHPLLACILQKRQQYLISEFGISSEQLQTMPMILQQEPKSKRRFKGEYCTRNQLLSKRREVIQQAGIQPEWIRIPDWDGAVATDLNRYEGDLFYTNIKFRLRQTCCFTQGEESYKEYA